MCEPFHSSIQFPDPDDFDDDSNASAQSSRGSFIGTIGKYFKKIGRWLHVSKMAAGHTEVLGSPKCADMQVHSFVAPSHVKWETNWATRQVILDHNDGIVEKLLPEARKASQVYSNAVSIGNLSILRKFLEETLLNTKEFRLRGYLEMFIEQLLNPTGATAFRKEFTRIFGRAACDMIPRHRLVKFLLGFTRHREYLSDAWSDDTGLWLPRKESASM